MSPPVSTEKKRRRSSRRKVKQAVDKNHGADATVAEEDDGDIANFLLANGVSAEMAHAPSGDSGVAAGGKQDMSFADTMKPI